MKILALLAAVTFTVFVIVPHVHAQAGLTFSGGNDAPLELTLDAPVTYVVTTASDGVGLGFDFQGVGNLFAEKAYVTGTITYTVDGGTPMSVPYLNSGFAEGSVAATDDYTFVPVPGVTVGDILVLNAGTLTTGADFEDAPPANGSYPTFLFDQYGNKLDVVDGISVPEPSTWVMIGTSFALLVGIWNYRLQQA